jgi:hypothetical protein
MTKDNGLVAELELVHKELSAWRASTPKEHKIPETVWNEAVRVAKKYGLNPVSKALGLDYSCLKKRVDGIRERKSRGLGLMPAFVELKPEYSSVDSACVVELEKGNGTRLRICSRTVGAIDWSKIKEVFLGA